MSLSMVNEKKLVTFDNIQHYHNKLSQVVDTKQESLVSGSNIKTINGQSILGDGDISNLADKPYVDEAIKNVKVDLTGFATEQWVNEQGFLKEHQDISHLAEKSELPTNTSDLTNDSGFITIDDVPVQEIPEEYVTEDEIVNFVEVQDTNDVLDDVETNTYVKYVAQSLTDEQKAQVRNNIGAASTDDYTEGVEFLNANTGVSEYPLFDEAKAYAVGDVVLYEGLLKRFTSAHEAGAWDGSQVESWNTLKDEKQAFLFTHPQLNKIFKEIFAPIDDYTKVNSVSVNKAVLVEGKWYNAIYVRGNDMPTYTVLSIYFDTQEEALSHANTTHLVIDSDNKGGVVLNMTLVPVGYNRYETKAIHPFTLPFAPYIASHIAIREEAIAREAADTDLGTRLDDETENLILSDNRIIKSIFEKEINLFDKYQIGIGYWNIYGLEINNQYIHTKPILFEKNRTYKWPYNKSGLGDNTGIAYVDANNTGIKYLRAEISEDGNYLLFTPESSGYYSINIGYVGTEDTFMVCLADEYPEEYVSHKSKIEKALFPIISRENTDWWVNRTSVNLFNKNNIFEGYWHSGGLQEDASYFHTEPIYLTAGNTYKYLKLGSLGSNLYLARVTADNTWISGHPANVSEDGNYLLFTPESSGYYSFNVGTEANTEYFMLCRVDEYPDTYEPYWSKWIVPDMFVEKSMLPNNISYNKLFGKKVTFDGDSICYGAGFRGGYGKIIAERNNMVYTNRGIGGGTITAELYSQSGAARHWISRDIPNIDPTSDYVILEGGVNDASLNPTLGEITDGFTSELDDTTFCGAFESMIKQCYDLFPNAKLGFIIVHQMTTRFNPGGEFYEKAIAILNKWGVPYLNLAIQAPPMNYIASLKEIYTANADGWHPNELGYKTFYCDKIEEWMRTL